MRITFVCLLTVVVLAADEVPVESSDAEWSPGDPNSFARPEEVVMTALHLRLRVDFEKKVLAGSAELTVERVDPAATHVVLDTRDLHVSSVTDLATGAPLDWVEGAVDPAFGRPLTVQLPAGGAARLAVQYRTRPNCTALAWLEPAQTAGRRQPFMFSQCEAISCRSMAPLQDSPAVKFPYSAEVTVPAALTALMSGLREGREPTDGGRAAVFRFRQPVPVPSYLIALAVGDLESRPLGPRSTVWAEPETVDAAAYEFADTERMLATAEELCGPYVWGVYDLLVAPPSFPFGGMENPCLTFVTPTLLAGDRSLADVVAHEIAHSWTGNLVTNRNWEHFWLNEGFTRFLERKIVGRLSGEPSRHQSAAVGWKDLRDAIRTRGDDNPLTCLVPRLDGVHPDDAFSAVPYEKGHTLLWYLEQLVGGRVKFEPFVKAYIAEFRLRSLDSGDFRAFLADFFPEQAEAGVFASVNWTAWFSTPGMPPYEPTFDTTLTDASSALRQRWLDWDETEPCPLSAGDLDTLSSKQIIEFLAQLLEEKPLSVAKLKKMEELYGMSARRNAEIRFRWVRMCVAGRWREQVPAALDMVNSQGRLKYVRPIYRDLYAWEEVRDVAIDNYHRNKQYMMHVLAEGVAKDLKLDT